MSDLAKKMIVLGTCAVLTVAVGACAQQPAPLLETPSDIGYATPAQALAALKAKPDVVFKEQRGWLVAVESAGKTVWSFPPQANPAYPSVVRRRIVSRDGALLVDTRVLCGGTKSVCDALVRSFQQLNDEIRKDVARTHPGQTAPEATSR